MLNEDSINVKIDFSIYPLPRVFFSPPPLYAFIFKWLGVGRVTSFILPVVTKRLCMLISTK